MPKLCKKLRLSVACVLQSGQEAAQCPEVALVLEKQGLDGALGPVLHSIGQHLHRHLIATQVVADKHHPFHTLHSEGGIG